MASDVVQDFGTLLWSADVSVEDLRRGERSVLRPLFDALAINWAGKDLERLEHSRCGTVYAYNDPEDGNGRIKIILRFPISGLKERL